MNPRFERYIRIDYSGAETPKSSLKGLRVYEADRLTASQEVTPPPNPRKYWTRKEVAEWQVEKLSEGPLTLVGIGSLRSRIRYHFQGNAEGSTLRLSLGVLLALCWFSLNWRGDVFR